MGSQENDAGDRQHTIWRSAVACLMALLLLVVGLNVYKYWPSGERSVAETIEPEEVTLNTRPTPTSTSEPGPASPQTLSIVLTDNRITINGSAPNPEIAEQMSSFPVGLYKDAASASFRLGVAELPAWLGSYPDVIRQLGTFSDAKLEIDENGTRLTGEVPNQRDLDRMERILSGTNGFPSLETTVQISGRQTAEVDVLPTAQQVNVGGVVPSQATKDLLVNSVESAYEVEVVDTITINPNVANQLNLVRFADDIVSLSAFKNQRISFDLGQTYSFISRELNFAPGESQLTPESSAALTDLPAFLTRTGLDVRIIGHTDDVGDKQVNTLLSIDRAKSVAALLLEADVESDQIIVIGRGERGSTDGATTDEERAGDRSVDIQIGTVIY